MNKEFLTIINTFDKVYKTKFNKTFDNNVKLNVFAFFSFTKFPPCVCRAKIWDELSKTELTSQFSVGAILYPGCPIMMVIAVAHPCPSKPCFSAAAGLDYMKECTQRLHIPHYVPYTANISVVGITIFYRVSFIIVILSYSLQWMAGYSHWQQLFLITGIDSR